MNKFCKALLMLLLCYCPNLFAQQGSIAMIDKLMSAQFKPTEPGANVLVAKNGKILYYKAFGMANLELDVPSDTGMVYYIASNTKQFTTVAILQLLEKGQLSLDDSLGKYVKSTTPVSPITIRQLLSHTSGLNGNGYRDSSNIPQGDNRQTEIERYAARNLAFTPGSKWQYNNANFQTLGYIIEKITGKTYADYISENIFKPAGMTASLVATSDEPIIRKRPAGYDILRRGIVNRVLHDTKEFYASGGILSTAKDMYLWSQALQSGILLQKNTLALAFKPQTLSDGKIIPYGFGWYIENIRGSAGYRHGGALPGWISETLYLPTEEVYVVILINAESAALPQALARIVAADLIGKPYLFAESPIETKYLGNYSGVYQNDRNELINITEVDGKTFYQRVSGRKYAMRHSVTDQFFLDKDFAWLEFERGADMKVAGMALSRVGLMPTSWKKTDKPVLNLSDTGKEQ